MAASSGLSLSAFLSHRRWFLLNIVLYWRQKFRTALRLWENSWEGRAGNIVLLGRFLPVLNLFVLIFCFSLIVKMLITVYPLRALAGSGYLRKR
ncbi:hypothetical protein TBC1_121070 [Lentimicrobium saccharophilum]|uniref:Uncharacterized protein n=1 Tax=Lentimicrobium saccharophilum TaxID=1678841 RepID=A0A0S7C4Y5_9BACT|nr:hypothetical protein TBC1_121070 [Lentimicrobium saccharophilum]